MESRKLSREKLRRLERQTEIISRVNRLIFGLAGLILGLAVVATTLGKAPLPLVLLMGSAVLGSAGLLFSSAVRRAFRPFEETDEDAPGRKQRLTLKPSLAAMRTGELLGLLVPRRIRKECFEPFFEDLKADRLEKLARTGSRRVKRWIEFCFYFRLCMTVVQSLGCYLGDTLAKIAPFLRALFFKGG